LEFKKIPGAIIIVSSLLSDDTHHGAVKFMVGSQMIQRNTGYPVKMAALVICHVSLLAALVWMFQ